MKKIITFVITSIFIVTISLVKVNAAYNYGPNGEIVTSADSIYVEKIVDSSNLIDEAGNLVDESIYSFGELYDIASYNDKIYLADYSNNCIVILNSHYQFITTFPKKDSGVTLSKPKGLYVTTSYIYVCDSENHRIAIFNHELDLVQEVLTPEDSAFAKYEFKPKKITVNRTGRMYVIAENINEGIIEFNPDGTFSRYYGMNSVTISAWKAFWLLFTSEEQREQQGSNFGASLSNLCIDKDEYVYTVSSPAAGATNVIKRLNYKGSDILTRNGYITQSGDIIKSSTENASTFTDIDVNDIGTYIVLDKIRGRIFAYDFEGNLLYIGGQIANAVDISQGTQSSMFQIPEALCYFNDKILVVDSKNHNMLSFAYTNFGKLVNQATEYYYHNDYTNAAKVWQDVLEQNTNYYLAYSGIGKAELREGKYKQAMVNLKLGYDEYNYSRAYQQYRYERMSKVFPYVIGIALGGCVYLLVRSFIKNAERTKREEEGLE